MVDEDYLGVVGVLLINHGKEDYVVTPKRRVAQLLVVKLHGGVVSHEDEDATSKIKAVPNLGGGSRGTQGFGSSGE